MTSSRTRLTQTTATALIILAWGAVVAVGAGAPPVTLAPP